MNNMDKGEILAVIKKKVYYAELPSKMDVSVMDDTLHIIIDADGVLQNMQNDASAFEGWVFCILANQRKHFNRFLLRVVWFVENYSWATVAKSKKETIEMFGRRISQLTLNFPLQDSKDKSEKGENDKAMKYEAMLETAVYQYLSTLGNANHQLPMGLFDGAVSKVTAITPGGASQADLWRIDHDKFYVYELKDCINSDNTHMPMSCIAYSSLMKFIIRTKLVSSAQTREKKLQGVLNLFSMPSIRTPSHKSRQFF